VPRTGDGPLSDPSAIRADRGVRIASGGSRPVRLNAAKEAHSHGSAAPPVAVILTTMRKAPGRAA